MYFRIDENDVEERLDKYLSTELSEFSRSKIQSLIKDGFVLVNKQVVKPNYKLRENDEVVITDFNEEDESLIPVDMQLDIRYEDEDVIVVNKPKGLVVHPGAGKEKVSLVAGLIAYTTELSDLNGALRPGIVHRIDKDTSGLMVIAKNNKIHEYLVELLKTHKIEREYVCLVHGVLEHDYGTIDAPIGRDERNRTNMTVTDKNAKEARTFFSVVRRYKKYSLVKCELETGRTHQIRVHMSYIKYPIVNDTRYGGKLDYKDVEGQILHAYKLSFKLPNDKEITVECELPAYFDSILMNLGEGHE